MTSKKIGETVGANSNKTAAILNLGCSKNQIDGERIMALLAAKGYEIIDNIADADIAVVNTCAFIKEAQEEAIDAILETAATLQTTAERKGHRGTLIVSGCFSQRYRDEVKEKFPEVDIWAGVDDWGACIELELSARQNDIPVPITQPDSPPKRILLSEPVSTQYIKIAEGCSHTCSFCAIPSIRGRFISRTEDKIIREAQWLYEQGTRELILVAQDTSFYGRDIRKNLTDLLKSLLRTTKFPWIRVMYMHPLFVNDELLELIASEPRLCPYFDIPLQHISDPILTAMNRQPASKNIYDIIDKIRSKVNNAVLRTTFIVGFPGETGKEFGELKNFIHMVRFDKLGVFPFSPEEGTPAYEMRPRPSNNVVQKRCDELMLIQQEISREILETRVGEQTQVIIDRISDDPDFNYEGRTRGDAPEVDGRVLIRLGNYEIGQIVDCKVVGASDYDLFV